MNTEIKCHKTDIDNVFRTGHIVWREPQLQLEPYGEIFRRCSYCGSIHPEDLIKLLKQGATVHGSPLADWKYGWPHKFYVQNIPNPQAGKIVEMGSRSGPDINESTPGAKKDYGHWYLPSMGPAPKTMTAKFYNIHLGDCSDDLFNQLAALLVQYTGIEWGRNEQGVYFKAPHTGYQKS